jgi:hypothetical protein
LVDFGGFLGARVSPLVPLFFFVCFSFVVVFDVSE